MIKRLLFSVCLILSFLCFSTVGGQTIFINEFLASNETINVDEDGDNADWLELYNASGRDLNLSGYTLSDDRKEPGKWVFSDVSLADGGFLLIWASDKDRQDGELHTNFKLDKDSDFIGVYAPDGTVLDSLSFFQQIQDVSFSRIPDGNGDFEFTSTPTPGYSNESGFGTDENLAFSVQSDFFHEEIEVQLLTNERDVAIRYTLDGSPVRSGSSRYVQPIAISETTTLRARSYRDGQPYSEDISQLYLFDYDGNLPVLSFIANRDDLYGATGIFDNPNQDWEKPVSVNYFEQDGDRFQINAGMKMHGGRSLRDEFPKLSMRLYFRSEYGASKLDYKLFKSRDLDEFDRLVIYGGGSSDQFFEGNGRINRQWSLIRDPLNHALWQEEGGAVSASRPVVVFVNGENHGVFHIRERIDDEYLKDNYDIDDADLLRPRDNRIEVQDGDTREWDSMVGFFERKNLQNDSEYEEALELIDVENFTDFQIFNIFVGNWDYGFTNNYMFRARTGGARWHWAMWDTDISFGSLGNQNNPTDNTLAWATRSEPMPDFAGIGDSEELVAWTLILRKLLENDDYETHFINRFADLMNTTLAGSHITDLVHQMAEDLRPCMHYEAEAWGGAAVSTWENGIGVIEWWARNRAEPQRNHIRNKFNAGRDRTVRLDVPAGGGVIKINTIIPDTYPWEGRYFEKVPVTVEAIADEGFVFDGWRGDLSDLTPKHEVSLNSDHTFEARFRATDVSLKLTAPNGGETFTQGDETRITWTSSGDIDDAMIEISFDDGATWFVVKDDTDNDGRYTWTVPGTASSQCLIRISANGLPVSDVSDDVFGIAAPVTPAISVLAPNGGERWTAGEQHLIRWQSESLSDSIAIAFSVNGGGLWYTIANAENLGEYQWTMPDLPSTQALIRVAGLSVGEPADTSDATFTIVGSSLVLTNPNGGEALNAGEIYTIRWSATGPVDSVKLELSADSGTSWIRITTTLAASENYEWTVPDMGVPECLLRISAANGRQAADLSNSTFAILGSKLVLGSPNGGETLVAGFPYEVTWSSSGPVDSVRLEFSLDGGGYWFSVADSFAPAGTYGWLVPRITEESCLIRISDAGDGMPFDTSDSLFAVEVQSITIVEPGPGATLLAGKNIVVKWRSQGSIDSVDIAYSLDSGSSWIELVANAANTGLFEWLVPDTTSEGVLVRITAEGDSRVVAETDDVFSIIRDVVSVAQVELPSVYALRNNYPNPFNAATNIVFELPVSGDVRLSVFDIRGNLVAHLVDGPLPAGVHTIQWSGNNARGSQASSGVYYLSMQVADRVFVRKLILVK